MDDLFKKMKTLALDQEQCVMDDRLDDFMSHAEKRNGIMDEISIIYQKYREIPNKNRKKGAKTFENSLSLEISEMIQSIQDTDKRIEELLKRNKNGLFDEIRSFKKGKNAIKGYGEKGKKIPRFIDRRS